MRYISTWQRNEDTCFCQNRNPDDPHIIGASALVS
jgi:hypothetical protein